MATLAIKVQSDELYKQRGLRSFSAWLKQTAEASDRQPSLIWRFLKAAKYFLKTIGSDQLERVSEALAPPEALEKLEKIERLAPNPVFQAIKERVLAGQATVSECRQIEKDYRPAANGRTNRGRPPKGQEGDIDYLGKWRFASEEPSAHQALEFIGVSIESSLHATSNPAQAQLTPSQMSSSIKRSLRADCSWLLECAESDSPPRNWGTHKEVRVLNSGTARKDFGSLLRLGLVAVAQWDLDAKDLFLVEVKTHLAELQVPHKWSDHLDYCNYFCFACPKGDPMLLEAIQETAVSIPSIGILIFDFSSPPQGQSAIYPCSISKFPVRQKGKKASVVFETLYERVMGWSVSSE